ncbi:hypothetical protein V1520DRAFT_46910 [Lipomyces starkeyi]
MADNLTGLTYGEITALNEDERMVTRHKRPDYSLLNDGLDDEASFEDRIPESDLESFISLSSSEILPSESASQVLKPVRPSSQLSLVILKKGIVSLRLPIGCGLI